MQQVKVLTSNCATQKEMEQFYWPERMQVVRLVVHTAQDTGICVQIHLCLQYILVETLYACHN